MWITPRPIQNLTKGFFWTVLEDDGIFQILKNKTSGSFLENILSTVRNINPLIFQPLTYRIIMINKYENQSYVIAVSDNENIIKKHWLYIKEILLPHIYSLKDKEIKNNQELSYLTNSNEYNNLHLDEEIFQYIIGKVASLAQLEEGEEIKNVETMIEKFHEIFESYQINNEKLLTFYHCTLWGALYPKKGILFITESFLCFYFESNNLRIVIPFKEIKSISKETIALGLLDNSIEIVFDNKEYIFVFVWRDQVYELIEMLWKKAMKNILESTEKDENKNNNNNDNNDTKIIIDNSTTKKMIDDSLRNDNFRKLFKLGSEDLLKDFFCSFWWENKYVVGRLYITHNFVCYQSNFTISGKELQFVIPFIEIESIQKTSISFGILNRGVSINMKYSQKFFFALYHIKEALETLNNLWKTRPNSQSLEEPFQWNAWSLDPKYVDSLNDNEINRQKKSWEDYFAIHGRFSSIIKTPKLREVLREGIPDEMRGIMWQILSGSRYKYLVNRGYYQHILNRHLNQTSEIIEEIEKDVTRALPNHPFFKTEPEAPGISMLRNVLIAFSWRNTQIGYCQSMNIIVATFLLYMSEEEAFWLLCTVCEDMIPEYYNKNLLGSVVDQQIFNSLVSSNLSNIYNHLEKLGLPLNLISLPWFMCLFLTYIPWKVSLRILDCFFYDGSNILLQAGLSLLKVNEQNILKTNDSEIIISLLRETDVDCDLLINTTFIDFGFLPVEKIEEMRNKQKFQTIRNLEESKKKKQIQQLEEEKKIKFTIFELEDIYEKFKSVLPPVTEGTLQEFSIDMEQCQELFQYFLSKTQSNWWDSNLSRLFQIFSKNKNKLEFHEFINILTQVMKGSLDDKFKLCFRICDKNDDQLINLEELKQLLKLLHNMSKKKVYEDDNINFIQIILNQLNNNNQNNNLIPFNELYDILIKKNYLKQYLNI